MATTYTTHLQLPKHDPTDPFNIALINEGFDKTEEGILTAYRGRAAYNFLGNGNFAINQRGQSEYTATGYSFDRWRFRSSNGGTVQKLTKGIRINAGTSGICGMYQRIATQNYTRAFDALAGEPVTLAIKVAANTLDNTFFLQMSDNNGTTTEGSGYISILSKSYPAGQTGILVATGKMPDTMTNEGILVMLRTNSAVSSGSIDIEWARLYKGTYTAENLPSDMTEDYANELLQCQQFLFPISFDGATITPLATGIANNATNLRFTLDLPVPFADIGVIPSIVVGETVVLRAYNGASYQTIDGATAAVKYTAGNKALIAVTGTFTANETYLVTGHTAASNPTKIFISNEP